MADLLVTIHDQRPAEPFRTFQSWAWEEKWVVPSWSRHPDSWRRAFEVLAGPAPAYEPTFLHRDFGHRNLLWSGDAVTGVVDWVETSTGPVWLDAAHAASNLALAFGTRPAQDFLRRYAAASGAGRRHPLAGHGHRRLPSAAREAADVRPHGPAPPPRRLARPRRARRGLS